MTMCFKCGNPHVFCRCLTLIDALACLFVAAYLASNILISIPKGR